MAAREGGADAARAEGSHARAERHRAPRALRRAVPRQEEQGGPGAGETHADRPAQGGEGRARDQIALLSRKTRGLGFDFLKPARSGRTVVEANGIEVAIGDRVLLRDTTFAIERGEHVALVGPNGSGKTTLLERLVNGEVGSLGYGVVVGYFSQQEMELDARGSVLQCVQSMTGLQRPDAQSLLGRFLFSGWDAH